MHANAHRPAVSLGIVLMLLSAAAFTASSVLAKLALQLGGVTGVQVAFFRFLLGIILAGLWLKATGAGRARPRSMRLVMLRAFFNTAAALLMYTALQYTTVTNTNMLNMTYPVFVFVLAPLVNAEHVRRLGYAFLAIALLGVCLVMTPDFSAVNRGDVLALLSGVAGGIAVSVLREARKHDSTPVILFYLMTFGAPLSLAGALPFWVTLTGPVLAAVLLSALAAVLGQILITMGYRHIDAPRGALVSTVRIPMAAALGVAVFGEALTVKLAAGGVLIMLALGGVSFVTRRAPHTNSRAA
jgi:drug/metabolite transporter (DMT)-like permease